VGSSPREVAPNVGSLRTSGVAELDVEESEEGPPSCSEELAESLGNCEPPSASARALGGGTESVPLAASEPPRSARRLSLSDARASEPPDGSKGAAPDASLAVSVASAVGSVASVAVPEVSFVSVLGSVASVVGSVASVAAPQVSVVSVLASVAVPQVGSVASVAAPQVSVVSVLGSVASVVGSVAAPQVSVVSVLASVAVPQVSVASVLGSVASAVLGSVASVVVPEVSVASVAVPVAVAEVSGEAAAEAVSMAIKSEDNTAPSEAGGGGSSA
jgi:hypothetical protein